MKGFGEDKICWKPDREKGFMVKDYYNILVGSNDYCFPWKSIWKQKIPSRVVFFVWTGATCARVMVNRLTISFFIVQLL